MTNQDEKIQHDSEHPKPPAASIVTMLVFGVLNGCAGCTVFVLVLISSALMSSNHYPMFGCALIAVVLVPIAFVLFERKLMQLSVDHTIIVALFSLACASVGASGVMWLFQ